MGAYVPSRGPIERRNIDKKEFQDEMVRVFRRIYERGGMDGVILGGDLNVVERNHVPHYAVFGEWEYEFYESFTGFGLADAYRFLHPQNQEYSWFGREGDGYRFDHFFVSKNAMKSITECNYIHLPRISKLGDHSAMYLKMVPNEEGKNVEHG